jgi:glycosyltransferase involved in cell wall biosynthesis
MFSHIVRKMTRCRGELVLRSSPSYVWNGFDVIVVDSPLGALALRATANLKRPLISTCHSFQNAEMYRNNLMWLLKAEPTLVIVTSAEDILEALRFSQFNATYIPITVNPARFPLQPYPDKFTIGYLGVDLPHKRFDRIDAVAEALGIPCVGSKRADHNNGEYVGREAEFYRAISCYVCATEVERAPFPTLEAMLCGRPVVSTPILASPPEVVECIKAGGGVLTEDLVHGVANVRDRFEAYAAAARQFKFNDTSSAWEEAILGTV